MQLLGRQLDNLNNPSLFFSFLQSEQQLFVDLAAMLNQTIEAIEFLEILDELNFIETLTSMPEARRLDLAAELTLESIVIDADKRSKGVQIVRDIFRQSPTARNAVDALSASFQQRCPSFVTSSDAVSFRGIELLERASSSSGSERDSAIAEAHTLWTREAHNVTPIQVAEIAQNYKNLKYYVGTVELALACAKASDPYNLALKYADGSDTSHTAKAAFDTRTRYYEIAIGAIEACFSESLERLQQQIISTSFKSDDSLFLFQLYDWLLSKNKQDLLLEVSNYGGRQR